MSARFSVCSVGLLLFLTSESLAQSEPAKDKEPLKPPQVRTYSTVTVVDDPAKAPRLPTKAPVSPPNRPAELRDAVPKAVEPKEDARPAHPSQLRENQPARPQADTKESGPEPARRDPTDRRSLESIRQELRATVKELRETGKRDDGSKAQAEPRQPERKPRIQLDKATRAALRERLGREN